MGFLCLTLLLISEGLATSQSYLWAAPLACLIVIAIAVDIPLTPFIGVALVVRVMTDASLFSPNIRHTGSVNLSAAIAIVFLLVAFGLILHHQRGVGPAIIAMGFLGLFTVVGVQSHGLSTVTIREGIREASILALGAIAFNASKTLTMATIVRVLQVAGCLSALLAIYQFATHTGVKINGEIRSNGTFTHPNEAAMYFAIATTASLWRYFRYGRNRLDLMFLLLFGAGAIATFSLSGLAALIAMLVAFGALRRHSIRLMFRSFAAAAIVIAIFLATPLGAERLANESSTSLNTTHNHLVKTTSLGWRIYKWELLLTEWQRAPIVGQGLGTTTTATGTAENITAGQVPHNEYLRYLVETGAVGLAIVIAGMVALLRGLARQRQFDRSDAVILAIAVFVGCLVNALADNTFLYSTTGYAAALVLGAAMATVGASQRTPDISQE
jgi:O-antigen ligase